MFNVNEIALNAEIIKDMEHDLFGNFFLMYFSFASQLDLDECLISFIFSCSLHKEYQKLLRERVPMIIYLAER